MKEEYIATIKAAGFRKVDITGEAIFPVEWLANDPTVQKTIKALEIPPEHIKDVANSVISIKVQATKTNSTGQTALRQ